MKVLGVDVQPRVEKEPLLDVPAIVMTDATPEASGPPDTTDAAPAKRKAPNTRASKATSQQGRSKSRRRPAAKAATASPSQRRAAKAAAQETSTKRTRDGSVGRETFAAVQALVKQGKSKTDAFNLVAAETGRNSGTVAANYYRAARASGAVKPRSTRRSRGTPSRVEGVSTEGTGGQPSSQNSLRLVRVSARDSDQLREIDRLTKELVKSVNDLTTAMKAQSLEVADLRQRLAGIRSLLK